MKTIKQIKVSILIMIWMMFFQFASAQWEVKSSNFDAQRGIVHFSAPNERDAYGIGYDANNFFGDPLDLLTITHDGGATWHSQNIPGLENFWLTGVTATPNNSVHAFGNNGGGKLVRSADGGKTWTPELTSGFLDATSFTDNIYFFNTNDGVVFGDPVNGQFEIYTTRNGGKNWSRVPPSNVPAPLANEYGLTYLFDHLGNTVWAMSVVFNNDGSTYGRLLQSDDRGNTWYVKNPNMPLNANDLGGTIKFSNASIGLYQNNATLYRTLDGGITWTQVNYTGTWFSYDLTNIPGNDGAWISTGGDPNLSFNSAKGIGSSISFDNGNHWILLDTGVSHTTVIMTSPNHGYSGGITSGSGSDGVFVYSPHSHHDDGRLPGSQPSNGSVLLAVYPNPSGGAFNLHVNAGNETACFIRIYNIKGQVVTEQTFNSSQGIRFGEELASGLYQAEVFIGNERHSIRLMKQ